MWDLYPSTELHSHRIKNANSHQISTFELVFVKYFIKTQNDKQIKGSLFFQPERWNTCDARSENGTSQNGG